MVSFFQCPPLFIPPFYCYFLNTVSLMRLQTENISNRVFYTKHSWVTGDVWRRMSDTVSSLLNGSWPFINLNISYSLCISLLMCSPLRVFPFQYVLLSMYSSLKVFLFQYFYLSISSSFNVFSSQCPLSFPPKVPYSQYYSFSMTPSFNIFS